MKNGTYTVAWKNVSTVDGHRVRGAFVFSVGEPISTAGLTDIEDQPLLQSPLEPVDRWLVLLGGLTLVGGMAFHLLVSRPTLNALSPGLALAVSADISRLAKAAFGVFLLASAAQLVIQASVVFESSLIGTLGGPAWELAFDTDWGHLWLWRTVLATASAATAIVGWRLGRDAIVITLAAALGAGALLTISLSSHAAATVNVQTAAIISDFIHLICVSIWVGGLFGLAVTLRLLARNGDAETRRHARSALVRRFSLVAGLSVSAIVVTGLYGAWAQILVPAAFQTPYGRVLIAKVTIVGLLLLIAAVNLVWIRPRLGQGGAAGLWLRRLVAAEIALASLVLLSVGFLTALEPARQVASREGIGVQSQLEFEDTVEGAEITLQIDPGHVGENTVRVSLNDAVGSPITDASDVRVRLSYLDADLGEAPYSAKAIGEGEYSLEKQLISIAGAWQADLVVQRPTAFDARTAFRFEVTGGGGGSLDIAPDRDTGVTLLGIELGVLGFLFMGVSLPIGGWFSRAGAAAMLTGVVGVVAGGALLFGVLDSEAEVPVRNPIAPTNDSIAAGLQIYQSNCQLCHGSGGRGDGPAGAGLDPPPADLVVHVPLHPERALFEFIRDGIPGTAMAAMGATLSDDQVWHVVNYIQVLE